ncbi:hypothetical protein DES49_2598 [Halospina denitrificans]|uniref:Uncharacterized protein n=1 Tax=Halospina denitrificans TaxID=332522 RepID=A0A4R7JLG8_9GAMM|nr:hypothetical protein [Halospina denitrificans]TDT38615.1 hypothetical protein DES49_2598 [Halospina denitrificans]
MLLKSLWRKTSRSTAAAGEPEHGHPAGRFRLRDHLTYTGDYHLERLSKLLELRYHRQFPWNSDDHIRSMIQFASRVQDQDIQRELLLFYLNCSPTVQEYLKTGGIVDGSHYIHNAESGNGNSRP